MQIRDFMNGLLGLRFENTFNPYADRCPVHDSPAAPKARSGILSAMLETAVQVEVDSIWIGRDLGYRGGRRTGLALTDDIHLDAHVARWGVRGERATRGQPMAERTAAVIWRLLSQLDSHIFLWNVFPLHPHEPNDPFSNRFHTAKECQAGEELLFQLIQLLRPRRLVAIGNNAAVSALRLTDNRTVVQVRHPSYGGQVDFLRETMKLYGLRDKPSRSLPLL